MHVPDKRRGGNLVRPTTTTTTAEGTKNSNANTTSASSTSSTHGSSMPTVPPRAAARSGIATTRSEGDAAHENKTCGCAAPAAAAAAAAAAPSLPETEAQGCSAVSNDAAGREKDSHIAHLEKQLALTERQVLRQRDHESETATFWQSKYSALNQQFLRTDTELRVLRSEEDAHEAERQEMRLERDVLRAERQRLHDEMNTLRSQVRDLKTFVSTSTRTDGQMSDQVFGHGMARLGNALQDWVITNFRRSKLVDFAELDEATLTQLSHLLPLYEDLAAQDAKIHLLQSVVSRILVDVIFDAYFVGLSDQQTRQFREMEKLLASLGPSDQAVNQWRAFTLALLGRAGAATPAAQHETQTDSHVHRATSRIHQVLTSLTVSNQAPHDAVTTLRALLTRAVELARQLVAQKAVLRTYMPDVLPHQRVLFDADTMEDVAGEDDEALAGREIWCVVFPGLVKHGDENGGQMQFRNVIAKARVLCGPDD